MTVMACSISNSTDRDPERFNSREKQFERAIKDLGGVDIPAQMLAIIVNELDRDPNQDFLGKLYMSLNLGSHWHGQFFTPYHVCEMMAKMQVTEECKGEIERKGYLSVCDPCIGAGAMLVAAATAFRELDINYQNCVVFAGQDIDSVVAKMAYIQISLLGCPGYITVGNSLTNPQTGHDLFPQATKEQDLWITPMFFSQIWEMRRQKELFMYLFRGVETSPLDEKEPPKVRSGRTEKKGRDEEMKGQLSIFDFMSPEPETRGLDDIPEDEMVRNLENLTGLAFKHHEDRYEAKYKKIMLYVHYDNYAMTDCTDRFIAVGYDTKAREGGGGPCDSIEEAAGKLKKYMEKAS